MRSRAVGMIAVIGAWSLLTGSDARRLRAEERQGDLVRVSSPAPDAMVKGLLDFAVQIAGLPGIASVEYRLNDRDLSGPLTIAPYRYSWHSTEVWDGPARVRAVARDATGLVVAESASVPFQVDNAGGRIRFASPDTARSLRGVVNWVVEVDRPQSEKEIERNKAAGELPDKKTEAIMFFLDGRLLHIGFGTSHDSIELDTTELANGRHELFASAWSNAQDLPPFAMAQVPVTVDNGHAPRQLRPRWRELRLHPGQSTDLAPRLTYTDGIGDVPAQGTRFSSANPAVATVDIKGRVRGIAPGVTTVAIEAGGRKAASSVIVDAQEGLAHFGRDGRILRRYDPKQSQFVRTMFGLGPDEIGRDPSLATQAHAAEINALQTGFYNNPADGSHSPDLATWKRDWDPSWERIERAAVEHDFGLVLTADDIARTRAEMADSVTSPWSAEAIRHAFARARDSRRVIAVEMIDEVSFLWGDTPTPTDGRWAKGQPPLPDDIFVRLMKTINGVRGRPPISWPIGGISGVGAARNWLGNPAFSDYASQYWDTIDWRKAYPRSASLPQIYLSGMDRVLSERLPVIPRSMPELLLVSTCGPSYEKRVPGDEYTPSQDLFQSAGPTPRQVAAEVMYAAAAGMAGVRAYSFDTMGDKEVRRLAPVGRSDLQTGAEPNHVGTDRWQAMASSFHLIRGLEPYLLQSPISAIDLGPLIYTGARQGPEGRLIIALNFDEMPEAIRADLRPYRYAGGSAIERHRLAGATLQVDIVPDTESDSLTLEPGETAVWLFRPGAGADAGTDRTPPAIAFTAPSPNATVPAQFVATAGATDAKLERIEFFLDGRLISTAKASPYTCAYDIGGVKEGTWHGLSAVAHDAAGNVSEARIAVRLGSPSGPDS